MSDKERKLPPQVPVRQQMLTLLGMGVGFLIAELFGDDLKKWAHARFSTEAIVTFLLVMLVLSVTALMLNSKVEES